MEREITKRNVVLVYVYSILTLGFYNLYWTVSTKRDINALGGDIPTTWICLIPFAYFYYLYKYCECFSKHVKKNDNGVLYFILSLFLGFVMPAIVQSGINDVVDENSPSPSHKLAA